MSSFEPCTLKRHEEGDSLAFQAKLTGAGANDMCNMQELTKDTILNLLKDRFKKEIVYTYVGDIVVSVNPFKNCGAVGKNIRNRYKKGGAQNAQLLMPHVYHLVDQTYSQMMTEQKSQSILISGESGAGKTEAMKIALTYIGEISVRPAGKDGKKPEADPTAARLMQVRIRTRAPPRLAAGSASVGLGRVLASVRLAQCARARAQQASRTRGCPPPPTRRVHVPLHALVTCMPPPFRPPVPTREGCAGAERAEVW